MNAVKADLNNLAGHSADLIAAEVNSAGKGVEKARRSLSDQFDSGKEMVFDGLSVTDGVIRKYPYYTISICAVGGLLLGLGASILIGQLYQSHAAGTTEPQ